jgi:hypothetical protein
MLALVAIIWLIAEEAEHATPALTPIQFFQDWLKAHETRETAA